MGEAVVGRKLAQELEGIVAPSLKALDSAFTVALSKIETQATDATKEANVKARMRRKWSRSATVIIRTGGGYVQKTSLARRHRRRELSIGARPIDVGDVAMAGGCGDSPHRF